MAEIYPESKLHDSIYNLLITTTVMSDAAYDKSIGCSEEFTPKVKIFAVIIVRKGARLYNQAHHQQF